MKNAHASAVALTLVAIGLVAVLLTPAPARSEEQAVTTPQTISAPNDGQGHIYLTWKPCELEIAKVVKERYATKGEPVYYTYSTVLEGTAGEITSHACWFVPKVDTKEMMSEFGQGFPIVNIITESGMIFPHAIGEFVPGEPVKPPRGETFHEPI